MKKILILVFFICSGCVPCLYGQSAMEREAQKRGIAVRMPPFLTASENDESIAPVSGKEWITTIDQIFGLVPAFGNTAINGLFALVSSIIRQDRGDYVVFVDFVGAKRVSYPPDGCYDRIRWNLRYGPHGASTKAYLTEIDLMLTHYPQEKAREYFNADWMVMYPMNLRGEVYEGKYPRSRAVVAYKDGIAIYIYFLMTDQTFRNFDDYLNDLKGVFWFEDQH